MDVPPSGGGGKSDHADENKLEKLEANKHINYVDKNKFTKQDVKDNGWTT